MTQVSLVNHKVLWIIFLVNYSYWRYGFGRRYCTKSMFISRNTGDDDQSVFLLFSFVVLFWFFCSYKILFCFSQYVMFWGTFLRNVSIHNFSRLKIFLNSCESICWLCPRKSYNVCNSIQNFILQSLLFFNPSVPGVHWKVTYTQTILQLEAAGLLKYVWPSVTKRLRSSLHHLWVTSCFSSAGAAITSRVSRSYGRAESFTCKGAVN